MCFNKNCVKLNFNANKLERNGEHLTPHLVLSFDYFHLVLSFDYRVKLHELLALLDKEKTAISINKNVP
jgi:hypothetical protein